MSEEPWFSLDDNAPAQVARCHQLRPYQQWAVSAVTDALQTSSICHVVAATGTGKTAIGCELIRLERLAGEGECLQIEPFIDLTAQTAARLRSWGVDCAIEQGGLRSHEPVTVACYASLLSRRRFERFIGRVKIVVVDEIHLNYTRQAIEMLKMFMEGGAKIVGLTATPDVSGDPLAKFYGPLVYNYSYRQARDDGWLVPLDIWMSVLEDLDLSAFKRNAGDFDQGELSRIMCQERAVQPIGSLIEQHHEGEPSIVFCQSIAHSEALRRDLTRRGILSAIVHSKMEPDERRMHIRDFEEGACNIILNVGVLTTGYDFPPAKKIFLAKPTLSRPRYGQMIGRILRPSPPGLVDGLRTPEERRAAIAASNKPAAEIFDITDSSRLNDLRTAVDLLCPDEDAALLARVRRRIERTGKVRDVDAVLEQERKALAAEQAAHDALTEHLRADLIADGKFTNYGRDSDSRAEQSAKSRRWVVMPFGKYKKTRFEHIPPGYLRWLLDNYPVKDPGLRATIERYARR